MNTEARAREILQNPDNILVIFDGHCNLCNGSVDFLIRRDKKGTLYYISSQHEAARKLLEEAGVEEDARSTILTLQGSHLRNRSSAVLHAAKHLKGIWPFLASVGLIVPRFLRDAVYRFVARNRYRFFGRRETCRLPTPEEQAHLIG